MMNDDESVERAMKDALESPADELFSAEEREKIASLVEDPQAQPGYDLMRGTLVWDDEIPAELEGDPIMPPAWWKLQMLCYHRSMSWRPKELEKGAEDHRAPWIAASRAAWEKAQASGLRWIGFLPARVDPGNLPLLIQLEEAELGDFSEG